MVIIIPLYIHFAHFSSFWLHKTSSFRKQNLLETTPWTHSQRKASGPSGCLQCGMCRHWGLEYSPGGCAAVSKLALLLWASTSYSVKEANKQPKTQSETVAVPLGSIEITDGASHSPYLSLGFKSWKDDHICLAAAQVKYLTVVWKVYGSLASSTINQRTKPPENCLPRPVRWPLQAFVRFNRDMGKSMEEEKWEPLAILQTGLCTWQKWEFGWCVLTWRAEAS